MPYGRHQYFLNRSVYLDKFEGFIQNPFTPMMDLSKPKSRMGRTSQLSIFESIVYQWMAQPCHLIDLQLCDFKGDFKQVITKKVSNFESTLKEEVANFLQEGPGSSTATLDEGLIRFDQWKTTLVRLR